MTAPQTLDRAGIAQRIPHRGSMCLLERLESWDADAIHCTTTTHAQAGNPLRTESGLLAPNAIEYAAQAMALHGGLLAAEGSTPSAGFLASARNVKLAVSRLALSSRSITSLISDPMSLPSVFMVAAARAPDRQRMRRSLS